MHSLWQIVFIIFQSFAPPLLGYFTGIGTLSYFHNSFVRQNIQHSKRMANTEPTAIGVMSKAIEETTQRTINPEGYTRKEISRAALAGVIAGGGVATVVAVFGVILHLP